VLTCERVEKLLGDYASREVVGAEKKALELHVSLCPDCGRRAAQYFQLIRVARALPAPAPSADAARRIRARLEGAMKHGTEAGRSLDETLPETPLS